MNWQIYIYINLYILFLEQYLDCFLCILQNKLSDLRHMTLYRLSADFGVMGIISEYINKIKQIKLTGIRSVFKFPFPGLNLPSLNHSLAKNIPTSKCCSFGSFATLRNNYHQKNSSRKTINRLGNNTLKQSIKRPEWRKNILSFKKSPF